MRKNVNLSRMFYFILHLSIADLLTAFLTLLPEVFWTLTLPEFYGGVVMCKFVKFGQMLGPYLSSYILIMTAVDRYQAICNPLGNCTWTPKRSLVRFPFIYINKYFHYPIYQNLDARLRLSMRPINILPNYLL